MKITYNKEELREMFIMLYEEIKEYEKYQRNYIFNIENGINEEVYINEKTKNFLNLPKKLQYYMLKELDRYNRRKNTCRKRIEYIISNYKKWKFVTFTFDNEHIKLDKKTLERRIKETLNAYTDNWIYNEDHGDINERLHYHAIIGFNEEFDLKEFINYYGYGAIKITSYKNNARALNTYINKLTNHSMKETTNIKVRYSRKRRKEKILCNKNAINLFNA